MPPSWWYGLCIDKLIVNKLASDLITIIMTKLLSMNQEKWQETNQEDLVACSIAQQFVHLLFVYRSCYGNTKEIEATQTCACKRRKEECIIDDLVHVLAFVHVVRYKPLADLVCGMH